MSPGIPRLLHAFIGLKSEGVFPSEAPLEESQQTGHSGARDVGSKREIRELEVSFGRERVPRGDVRSSRGWG